MEEKRKGAKEASKSDSPKEEDVDKILSATPELKETNVKKGKKLAKVEGRRLREFLEFAEEFRGESDRAAVILGAARLDNLLYQILARFLKPSSTTKDQFLEGDSPCGTFSSRTMLVHRLGLIDDEMCKALNLIRKVRNVFAHEFSGVTLDGGGHRDRIRELVAPIRGSKLFDVLVEHSSDKQDCPSAEFRAAVAWIAQRLEGIFERTETLTYVGPCSLRVPDKTLARYKGDD